MKKGQNSFFSKNHREQDSFFSKNHSAQVTIFIIVGIIIISAVALVLILRSDILPDFGGGGETNPQSFLETCLEDKLNEGVRIISEHGGNINPVLYKRFKFEGETSYTNISYLCYTQNYYVPCVNQEPMLMKHIKEEIHDYIAQDVSACFNELKDSLENQGYRIDEPNSNYNGFDVELAEKKIIINIDGELTLTKTEQTTKQQDFKIIIPSRLYEIAFVVQEIVSQEATNCEFDLDYIRFYSDYDINKINTLDSSEIYVVTDKKSLNRFNFAVKGCVIPAGG